MLRFNMETTAKEVQEVIFKKQNGEMLQRS